MFLFCFCFGPGENDNAIAISTKILRKKLVLKSASQGF